MGKTNIFAILGLVFAFLIPILGIIFSVISLVQIPKKKEAGKRLAIAGLIVGVILLILYPILSIKIIEKLAMDGHLSPGNFV